METEGDDVASASAATRGILRNPAIARAMTTRTLTPIDAMMFAFIVAIGSVDKLAYKSLWRSLSKKDEH
jgi:hypothetical protein